MYVSAVVTQHAPLSNGVSADLEEKMGLIPAHIYFAADIASVRSTCHSCPRIHAALPAGAQGKGLSLTVVSEY